MTRPRFFRRQTAIFALCMFAFLLLTPGHDTDRAGAQEGLSRQVAAYIPISVTVDSPNKGSVAGPGDKVTVTLTIPATIVAQHKRAGKPLSVNFQFTAYDTDMIYSNALTTEEQESHFSGFPMNTTVAATTTTFTFTVNPRLQLTTYFDHCIIVAEAQNGTNMIGACMVTLCKLPISAQPHSDSVKPASHSHRHRRPASHKQRHA